MGDSSMSASELRNRYQHFEIRTTLPAVLRQEVTQTLEVVVLRVLAVVLVAGPLGHPISGRRVGAPARDAVPIIPHLLRVQERFSYHRCYGS